MPAFTAMFTRIEYSYPVSLLLMSCINCYFISNFEGNIICNADWKVFLIRLFYGFISLQSFFAILLAVKHNFGFTPPPLYDRIYHKSGLGETVFGRLMTVTVIRKKCRGIQYKGDEQEPQTSPVLGLWLRTSTDCIFRDA